MHGETSLKKQGFDTEKLINESEIKNKQMEFCGDVLFQTWNDLCMENLIENRSA